MKLCTICNSANSNYFENSNSDCLICQNNLSKIDSMISSGLGLLSQLNGCKTFSVSTLIPKDWLIREEMLWDIKSRGSCSIKSHLNRYIVDALDQKCGLSISGDGDVRLTFDVLSGQVTLVQNEIFIFGRYKKYKAGLSQSRWSCFTCKGEGCKECSNSGKNFDSVEERIGEHMKNLFDSSGYVLHASGREDIDALNTGGRPFCMEIKSPKKRDVNLNLLPSLISASGEVAVSDLQYVSRSFVELVSESHFDKSYSAVTQFAKKLTLEDVSKIESLSGSMLFQFTPERVAHRRANITRQRLVKHVGVSDVLDNVATLHITAEAGTYIKELISSDNGRTKPSVKEIICTDAKCILLTVTHIEDPFLTFICSARNLI
jgi:tRNA pseudouridine synthase 10